MRWKISTWCLLQKSLLGMHHKSFSGKFSLLSNYQFPHLNNAANIFWISYFNQRNFHKFCHFCKSFSHIFFQKYLGKFVLSNVSETPIRESLSSCVFLNYDKISRFYAVASFLTKIIPVSGNYLTSMNIMNKFPVNSSCNTFCVFL